MKFCIHKKSESDTFALPVVNNVFLFRCVTGVNKISARAIDPINFLIIIFINFAHRALKLSRSRCIGSDFNPLQSRTRLKLSIQLSAKYFEY